MELKTIYTISTLTEDYVNILIEDVTNLDGVQYTVRRSRVSYANSPIGRDKVINDLPIEYSTTILTLWGETPTQKDPLPPIINEN